MARILPPMREVAQEQQLVRRARDGDREAFDRLVRLHFASVYSLLHRMIANHEDAEDLTQECFVRAWGALRWYREDAPFAPWLQRIALHLAVDRQRAGGRRPRELELVEPEGGRGAGDAAFESRAERDPLEQASHGEFVRQLSLALLQLPWKLRAALVLRSLEGLEYDELARVTGVEPATARTHVMQARKRLQHLLARWLEERP